MSRASSSAGARSRVAAPARNAARGAAAPQVDEAAAAVVALMGYNKPHSASLPSNPSAGSSTKRMRATLDEKSEHEVSAPAPASGGGGKRNNKLAELEHQVEMLEEENVALRTQLRVGKETTDIDERDRLIAIERIEQALATGATDKEISALVSEFGNRFSDFGATRARAVDRHLDQLDALLNPTQVTKMALWTLYQDDAFFVGDAERRTAPDPIWTTMVREMGATPEQQENIKMYREDARALIHGLRSTHLECMELRKRVTRKNAAMSEEVKELSQILTARQLAKFLVWVNRNPATVSLLDRVWNLDPKPTSSNTGQAIDGATSSLVTTTTSSTSKPME